MILKLYWLRFQYNKWQCGFLPYKTVFPNTDASYVVVCRGFKWSYRAVLPIHVTEMIERWVNESLRGEMRSFCQGQMNIWHVQLTGAGGRRTAWRCLVDSFPRRSSETAGGSADCFPPAPRFSRLFVLFFLIQRLIEPILTNFGLKPFSAQAQGSWRTGQATSMDIFFFFSSLIMAPWASTVIYKVPQESGANKY